MDLSGLMIGAAYWSLVIGAKGGTRTPTCQGRQEPESGGKPINDNKLQQAIIRNSKKRRCLQDARMASECCVLLANNAVC